MHIQIADFGTACIMKSQEPYVEENKLAKVSDKVLRLDLNDGPVLNDRPESNDKPESNHKPGPGVRPRRRLSFVGTAQYVSPEMLNNIEKVGRSADLWAFGCIVYQLTSGSLAFKDHSELQIFQKILSLDYKFPDGFNPVIRDLVENILKLDPDERLGAKDELKDRTGANQPYKSIRSHPFFEPLNDRWDYLHNQKAPPILPYLPKSSNSEELRSEFKCIDIEPGLDHRQMSRLLGLQLYDDDTEEEYTDQSYTTRKSIMDFSLEEMKTRLEKQRKEHEYHRFVDNNLILKEALINKRKGLFARKRMFLLTTGPHIYYVDPEKKVLKGEIPFTIHLSPELKTFKNFFVHTPKRIYYLEDPSSNAKSWVDAIGDVKKYYEKELKEKDQKEMSKMKREMDLIKSNK